MPEARVCKKKKVKDFLWFNIIIQGPSMCVNVGHPHVKHLGSDERRYKQQMIIIMRKLTYWHKVVLLQPDHVPDLHVHPLGLLKAEERTTTVTRRLY